MGSRRTSSPELQATGEMVRRSRSGTPNRSTSETTPLFNSTSARSGAEHRLFSPAARESSQSRSWVTSASSGPGTRPGAK
uniref:Uncharacterized protein n=1 Tax=Human herpesvirus 2 TaxID=10310 RepID=A0A481TX70_HHV2|nr:hypothetical protein [Human alphaherpesvirus 2]